MFNSAGPDVKRCNIIVFPSDAKSGKLDVIVKNLIFSSSMTIWLNKLDRLFKAGMG
jgi:hypothetical protein